MRHAIGLCAAAGLFCLAGSVWAQQAKEAGLVGYWSFDSLVDNQTPDLSGNGNLGRISGALGVTRGSGSALRFDGVDDYVNCGAGPSSNFTKAISVAVWVYPEARPKGEPAIVNAARPGDLGVDVLPGWPLLVVRLLRWHGACRRGAGGLAKRRHHRSDGCSSQHDVARPGTCLGSSRSAASHQARTRPAPSPGVC